jgi:RNA polymerase sigma factor (sigma-70 family)
MAHERTHQHFLELIHRHQSIIHKICFVYCKSRPDREDLQQEIILQLWKSYPSFQGNAAFSTWMYRVALNTAINQTKRPGLLFDSSSSPEILYDPSNFGKWRRPLFYCGLRRRLTKRSQNPSGLA